MAPARFSRGSWFMNSLAPDDVNGTRRFLRRGFSLSFFQLSCSTFFYATAMPWFSTPRHTCTGSPRLFSPPFQPLLYHPSTNPTTVVAADPRGLWVFFFFLSFPVLVRLIRVIWRRKGRAAPVLHCLSDEEARGGERTRVPDSVPKRKKISRARSRSPRPLLRGRCWEDGARAGTRGSRETPEMDSKQWHYGHRYHTHTHRSWAWESPGPRLAMHTARFWRDWMAGPGLASWVSLAGACRAVHILV